VLIPAGHEQGLAQVLFMYLIGDGLPCAHIVQTYWGEGAYERACALAQERNKAVRESPDDWRPGARFEVHTPRTGKPTLAKIHDDAEHAYRRMVRR